ncbi:MAG: fumarylacetoacetate hydrolase family protein, partial [Microbacterium sp.]|nr:fumarylacetoacetate hydrolase family protein [Microbacterium sp.]
VPGTRIVAVSIVGAVDIARFPTRPRITVEFFEPADGQAQDGESAITLTKRVMAEIRSRAPFVAAADLHVQLELNVLTMQDASTSDLLFDLPALVAGASWNMPLLPGDLLLTGSPAGNGQHWKRFLRDGDVITRSIEGLGTQVVRCIAEDGR